MTLNKSKLSRSIETVLNSCLYIMVFLLIQPSLTAQDESSTDFNEYKGMIVDGKTKK